MEQQTLTKEDKHRQVANNYYTRKIHENPEFYQKEKQRNKEYLVKRYNEDPDFKEKMKQYAREAYHKRKNRLDTIPVC